MSQRFFEDVQHAKAYAEFRPKPPQQLGDRIVDFLRLKYTGPLELCVDVGCGNGQCVPLFSSRFRKVLATDISPAQIHTALALDHPANVEFRISPAESLAVESGTVQLLNSSQACHWFDLPVFFKEVDRVLSPGGVVALSGYFEPTFTHPTRTAELRQLMDDFYHVDLLHYRPAGSMEVFNEYRNITIPYAEKTREEIWTNEEVVSLAAVSNDLATYSGFQWFCKEEGREAAQVLLDQYIERFKELLDTTEPPERIFLNFKRKYFLLMGRKPFK